MDPTRSPLAVVPLSGFAGGVRRAYLHEVALYIGTATRFERLAAKLAFTHPGEGAITFNVLGRRGFLDRIQFGLRDGLIQPQMYVTLQP